MADNKEEMTEVTEVEEKGTVEEVREEQAREEEERANKREKIDEAVTIEEDMDENKGGMGRMEER